MKIRTKLFVAFMVIILVPIVLSAACAFAISQYQLNIMKDYYGIEQPGYDELTDSTQLFNKLTQKIYGEITNVALHTPEKFEDITYLDELNGKLLKKYSFLLVREGDAIIYNGGNEKLADIESMLPNYGHYEPGMESGLYLGGGDVRYLIKELNFILNNGKQGSIFIATEVSQIVPEVQGMLGEILLAVIIILSITACLLVAWIYNSMVKPLNQLKIAANNIAQGNLDFEINAKSDDEIGELCEDFEEMRKRLKESAEEKIEYDKESKELISNISHDLKTPITSIKGYVEGIMDGVADTPEKIERYIKTIYSKANDMEHLIEELTFYSKIDTNKIPYNFKKIDIDQYFRDCVEELGMDLEAKNIDLTYFNYAQEPIHVIADPEQLKKVVNNIVGNSVKYIGDKKGIINIRIKDADDFVQIEIEDNGKGIAIRDLPYIFDRFYRTDASRNSSQGGSGIGLSIVKKIIEDHGGRIWATSKENTGTEMHIIFRKYKELL